MMKEFIYCESLNGVIEWTRGSIVQIIEWLECDEDREKFKEFSEKAKFGEFITTERGHLIFCTNSSGGKPEKKKPKALLEVLEEAGLLGN